MAAVGADAEPAPAAAPITLSSSFILDILMRLVAVLS
jgi:hypothetical protein